MTPSCPTGYKCEFTPKGPPHYWVHWWDGPWGIVVALVCVAALVAILCTIAVQVKQLRENKQRFAREKELRAHEQFIEEQHTMQLDAAKGDPEMLKIVRSMQR